MAFRERTVTGTVVDGDGAPVQTGTVQFKPTKPVGYTSTHVVIDRVFTAETDAAGLFSVTLWCDEDSLKAIDYIVTFPIENNGQPSPLHFEVISLAYESGTSKDIGTLIAESQPPPTEVPEATWAALIDARIAQMPIKEITATPYSLVDADSGFLIRMNLGTAMVLNVPSSLPNSFQCAVLQDGAGQVTLTGTGGANVRNRNSHTKTAGQYAVCSLFKVAADEFRLQGDTAA